MRRSGGIPTIGYGPFSRSLVTRIAKEMAAQRLELEVRLDEDVTPELLRRVTARELVAAAVMETPAAARRHGVRVDALSDEPLLAALPAPHGYARAHAIPVGAFAGISEIVDHHEEQIRALDEAPVLIGHSFGGRIVELLLDRGLGRAGVAISPAPPKGIPVLPISSLKAAAPALAHPSKRNGIVTLSLKDFTYGFVNMFSAEDAAAAYERYAVPETGRIFYEAGLANFHLNPPTEVLFKNAARAPLLIVGAQEDNTVPASLARKQYEKYGRSPATTEYVEFEGRPHLLMAAEGWEEVAASTDSWLDGVLEGCPCRRAAFPPERRPLPSPTAGQVQLNDVGCARRHDPAGERLYGHRAESQGSALGPRLAHLGPFLAVMDDVVGDERAAQPGHRRECRQRR
jgi:alpha-beta hydrolase superfamily lysophospholipase